MHLDFHGAADGVTGSLHRIHVNGTDILLDCGLFQGHRAESTRANRQLPDWALKAQALILSHAHLDHSGNIPSLVKRGFEGNIFCTPATRDLCSVMLRDSAMIQQQDARYLNKRHRRDGIDTVVEPLYSVEDAYEAVKRMISIPLHLQFPITPHAKMTFFDAGHVLGSAMIRLDLEERGQRRSVLYTGDLGREELPLLSHPEVVEGIDFLILESTYGDRLHPDFATVDDQLSEVVNTTIERGGRVYIPTFALERAQEVLFALERLHERGAVPRVPIYIDSPLAIAITEIYKLHPESLDRSVRERILDRNDPFSPPGLHYVSDIASSRRLQESGEPCIVIAGSGMCEGGRILHHFARGIGDKKNTVVLVGFMAQHTLGRRLQEGRREAKVYGIEREVRAQIRTLAGLSAHADRDDLVTFVRETAKKGPLRQVALVHGEDPAKRSLKEELSPLGFEVFVAEKGRRVDL